MHDRPVARKIIKLGFQLLFGRRRAHWQDNWPFLKLIRAQHNTPGQILWKGQAAGTLFPVTEFYAAVGREVVIFGSGPSLRSQDVARIDASAALLVNGAVTLMPRLQGAFAIAIEDERFVWRHFGNMLQQLPRDPVFLLSPSVIRAILSHDASWCDGRRIVLIENLYKPFDGARRRFSDASVQKVVTGTGENCFSRDPGVGIIPAGTVAFSAMQFAIAARPECIGLAGIDLSNADGPRFYENGAQAASGIVGAEQRILNHFEYVAEQAGKLGVTIEVYSRVSALLTRGLPYSDRLVQVR
jgi:hypothetical protein